MDFKAQIEEATPELRKDDVVVIKWKGDIVNKTAAYLCVKAHTRSGQARVALQNLNGLGRAFLKPNEMSIMKELERAQEKGDLAYKHYSKDDYMMVAMHRGATE